MSRRPRRRELLLLRHAKSDRDAGAPTDFARPLARRGRKDCRRMARWIAENGLHPDLVLASPAVRSRDTVERILDRIGVGAESVRWDEALYLASYRTLLATLAAAPQDARRVLLAGHNPGLDDLLLHLTAGRAARAASGKLMTTAALARLRLPADWAGLPEGCGELLALVRPRELRGRGTVGR